MNKGGVINVKQLRENIIPEIDKLLILVLVYLVQNYIHCRNSQPTQALSNNSFSKDVFPLLWIIFLCDHKGS